MTDAGEVHGANREELSVCSGLPHGTNGDFFVENCPLFLVIFSNIHVEATMLSEVVCESRYRALTIASKSRRHDRASSCYFLLDENLPFTVEFLGNNRRFTIPGSIENTFRIGSSCRKSLQGTRRRVKSCRHDCALSCYLFVSFR